MRADSTRDYDYSGHYATAKRLPGVLERVKSGETLTGFEEACREVRQELLDHAGGDDIPVTRRLLVDAVLGSWILLQSADSYLASIGEGVVDKRNRRLRRIVLDRQRVADSLVKQVQALGVDPSRPKLAALATLLGSAEPPNGNGAACAAQDGDAAGPDDPTPHPPPEAATEPLRRSDGATED